MAIKYADKKSARSIIDNEVYVVLFKSIKMEVAKYNEISTDLISKIKVNLQLTNKLNEGDTRAKEFNNIQSKFKKSSRKKY